MIHVQLTDEKFWGDGLPARLLFEIEGVLIISRFFLNIFNLLFDSPPISLSLKHKPPTHLPTFQSGCLTLLVVSLPSIPIVSQDSCLNALLVSLLEC